jgi:DNA-binding SARP family transcriptional activator
MIEIGTFGGLVVRKDRRIVCRNLGRVTGELLTYLAVNTRSALRRESIAELIWPGKCAEASRALLNTSIWRINESLKASGIEAHAQVERVNETSICLDLTPEVTVDVTELSDIVASSERSLTRSGLPGADLSGDLRRALDRYHGAFLEGSDNDWVLHARERYRCLHARGMTILMRVYTTAGRIEEALDCGRAILHEDEFRETTQRAVMWLHVMNGQRSEAIAQYRRLEERLMDEIGVGPMRETTLLYHHILTDTELAAQSDRDITIRPSPTGTLSRKMRAQCEDRALVFESIVNSDTGAV